jgi:hypothetical protein
LEQVPEMFLTRPASPVEFPDVKERVLLHELLGAGPATAT